MKYWGYLCVKLAVAVGVLYYLWRGILFLLPPPPPFLTISQSRFPHDLPSTLIAGVYFLFCCGVLYACILEQRYRCRVCLRRLRMPIEKGSWGHMLQLGRPRIEYICPFGHGTLRVPEAQIAGLEAYDWEPHDDIWVELYSLQETKK